MAELEMKTQQMDIEANGKHLEAEDYQIAAQHKHEHEKEQHDMQILCLCLQHQGGCGIAGCATPAAQFSSVMEGLANPSAFRDMEMGMGGNFLCSPSQMYC